jgi:ribosomal protein S8
VRFKFQNIVNDIANSIIKNNTQVCIKNTNSNINIVNTLFRLGYIKFFQIKNKRIIIKLKNDQYKQYACFGVNKTYKTNKCLNLKQKHKAYNHFDVIILHCGNNNNNSYILSLL